MPKTPEPLRNTAKEKESRAGGNFSKDSLEASLAMTLTMQDEMGGKPMESLFLHDDLGFSPDSSNTRKILSFFCKAEIADEAGKVARNSFTDPVDAATNKIATRRLKALIAASLVCP
jgi:hypothetical protein